MTQPLTVLVTIHGIGFQQAPENGLQGYADGLHDHLKVHLGTNLGSDPLPEFGRQAGEGAVYVHSDWPVTSRIMEGGLSRLGTWKNNDASTGELDTTGAPLQEGDRPIAHVALVYSHLEDQGAHLGASIETFAKAFVSQGHYATVASIVRMGVVDIWSVLKHHKQATETPTPSLQVRSKAMQDLATGQDPGSPSGPFAVVQQLDRDVATYICRNDLRERVRAFVHDAITRLCARSDVENVVVNAHSQGTVLAFDVLRQVNHPKLSSFITAGSPLRKYVDLFYWGQDAACIHTMPWENYWDLTDPVADPLEPPKEWKRGRDVPPSTGQSDLFRWLHLDSPDDTPIRLEDVLTSNADHGAGGGLPAHNYWDNDEQFVQPLAGLLQKVSAQNLTAV